jgi:hypothetical protein
MPADTGQAEISSNATLRKFDGCLVGDLSDVRVHKRYKISDDSHIFSIPSHYYLINLNLLTLEFSCNFTHTTRAGSLDAIIGDRFNVLYFNYLSINSQLFDRLFSSLHELVAFGSTHAENFDLFHIILLLYSNFLISSGDSSYRLRATCPVGKLFPN